MDKIDLCRLMCVDAKDKPTDEFDKVQMLIQVNFCGSQLGTMTYLCYVYSNIKQHWFVWVWSYRCGSFGFGISKWACMHALAQMHNDVVKNRKYFFCSGFTSALYHNNGLHVKSSIS